MKNKNIGILTFHKSYNYGAFMQCYSLVNKIKSDFPNINVEIIDYTCSSVMINYEKWVNSFSLNLRQPFIRKKLKIRNSHFDSFQKYLPLSEYSIVSDDYNDLFNKIKNKYDIIIVGSDAVWNWNIRGFPNAYFLNSNLGSNLLSYAASSYGQDFTQLTKQQELFLYEAWNNYMYLGVRDLATEKFIKKIDDKLQPFHNCDPTVFLNLTELPVDMVKLKNKLINAGVNFNRPLLGLMGGSSLGKNVKRNFGKSFQIIAIYEPNPYADIFLYDLNPFEWARVFSFFSITFTHFFHGTLLSLKNLKPTIIIESESDYSSKFDTKIKDVLNRFQLTEFYYTKQEMESHGWDGLKNKVVELIANPPFQKIKTAIEIEANNYNSFKEALNKIL